MKNPLKKEYLNLYKKRADGAYEFTGSYYQYCGDNFKKQVSLAAALEIALAAVIIGSGCLNAAGLKNSFYVIIPYIGEIAALFALAWNTAKLFTKGERVKQYIYASAYPRLTPAALGLAVVSATALICSVVFIILNGAEGGVLKCVIYNVLKLLSIAISLAFSLYIKKINYEVK